MKACNTLRNRSYIIVQQYIFTIMLSCLLVLPIILFDYKGTVALKEKRTLSPPPMLHKEGKLNELFFIDCDKYLRDRFGLRDKLALLYANTERLSLVTTKHVLFGKSGYLYYVDARNIYTLADFFKDNLFSKEELTRTVALIKDRRDWCLAHGIKFFTVIAPAKYAIYDEYYPFERPIGLERADQLKAALEEANIDVIFPKDLLIKNKSQYPAPLYYLTDTHWNDIAGFIASKPILDKIHKLFPAINFPKIDEVDIDVTWEKGKGDLVSMIGLKSYGKDFTTIVKPKGKDWSDYYTISNPDSAPKLDYYTEGYDDSLPKLLMFNDSFAGYLEPYLSTQFYKACYMWHVFKEEDKDYVLKYKPDVVIWEWGQRYTGILFQH